MIKLVFCVRRTPGMTPAAFAEYWRERHAPLVAERAKALGIRRYVQLHTLDSPLNAALAAPRGAPEPFDGIAELWWDDADAMAAPMRTHDGRRAARELIEDEARFIDLARSPIWLATEREIPLGPSH
jgi:uncharacterized protein (TIGR02118 family)